MLINRSDLRGLFFLFCSAGLLVLMQLNEISWYSPVVIAVTAFSCAIVTLVNHNQIHVDAFQGTIPNIIFNVLMSLCLMVPVTAIFVAHVNHHTHRNGPDDWAGAHFDPKYRNPFLRYLVYALLARKAVNRQSLWRRALKLPYVRSISFKCEVAGLVGLLALGFYFQPLTFLLHWFLPAYLGVTLFIAYNLLEHDGCDSKSEFNHSKNFLSRFENFFLLNSGYHTAHHNKPRLHWSKLPEYHAQNLQDKVDVRFQKRSILSPFMNAK